MGDVLLSQSLYSFAHSLGHRPKWTKQGKAFLTEVQTEKGDAEIAVIEMNLQNKMVYTASLFPLESVQDTVRNCIKTLLLQGNFDFTNFLIFALDEKETVWVRYNVDCSLDIEENFHKYIEARTAVTLQIDDTDVLLEKWIQRCLGK